MALLQVALPFWVRAEGPPPSSGKHPGSLPDRTLRGELLDAILERVLAMGASSLLTYFAFADAASMAFLDPRGAQPAAGYLRLRGALTRLDVAPSLPAGWGLAHVSGAGGAELALAAPRVAWGDLPRQTLPHRRASLKRWRRSGRTSPHSARLREAGRRRGAFSAAEVGRRLRGRAGSGTCGHLA